MRESFDLVGARELDVRCGDGIVVRLLWQEGNDLVHVHVMDSRTSEEFLVTVDGADALDAFRHPFAYAHCTARDRVLVLHEYGEEVAT
jgi:hypothetical protein